MEPQNFDESSLGVRLAEANGEDENSITRYDDNTCSGVLREKLALSHDKQAEGCDSERKLFACPYFKNNPTKFKGIRTCIGPGFMSISRLKEHLYRKHAPPRHICSRCFNSYKTELELHEHQRSQIICPIRLDRYTEGQMTLHQQQILRSKKRDKTILTEEDKWTAIYFVLFPESEHASVPSPYYPEEKLQEPGVPQTKMFSRDEYEDFLETAPPFDIAKEIESEVRQLLRAPGGTIEREDQLCQIAWRLQASIFKNFTKSISQQASTQD